MKIKRGVLGGARRARQKGMTLLEIVVSMLIVALGLAISVSMIQTANRFGDTAEYTAFALQKSQLIIDTMRANSLGRRAYVFRQSSAAAPRPEDVDYATVYNSLNGVFDAANRDTVISNFANQLHCAATCTSAENNAKADIKAWLGEILDTLPGGRALIISHAHEQYEVMVMWQNVPATSNDSADNATVQGTRVLFTL